MELPEKLASSHLEEIQERLPDEFTLALSDRNLLLTLHSRASQMCKLVTFGITPFKKAGFSGDTLVPFLEDLAQTVLQKYEEMGEGTEEIENKVLKTVNTPVGEAIERHFTNHEYRIRIERIHTASQDDWYGPPSPSTRQ